MSLLAKPRAKQMHRCNDLDWNVYLSVVIQILWTRSQASAQFSSLPLQKASDFSEGRAWDGATNSAEALYCATGDCHHHYHKFPN